MWRYKTKNQYKYESNTFIFENIRITKIKSTAKSEPHTKYQNRTVATKIRSNVFVIKPTRCTNFTNLFCHETVHISDDSSVHHQEFIHCTLDTGICHTSLQTALEQDQDPRPARKLSTNLYDIYHC